MLLSLLLLPGCITLDSNDCSNQQYLALNGDCVRDPGIADIELDTADPDLDADADDGGDETAGNDGGSESAGEAAGGADGTAETDGMGGDADAGGMGGGSGEPMLEYVEITCDVGSWDYQIATSIPTESATFTVTETGSDNTPPPEEFHTLVTGGPSGSGGELYERNLLLVDGYYFEDVATQFACVDGSNELLTWQLDLFSDADRTQPIGCVAWGHNTTAAEAAGCQLR